MRDATTYQAGGHGDELDGEPDGPEAQERRRGVREQARHDEEGRRILVGIEHEPVHGDALAVAGGVPRRLVSLQAIDVGDVVHLLAGDPVGRDARVPHPPSVPGLDAVGDLRRIDHEHGEPRELDERDRQGCRAEAERLAGGSAATSSTARRSGCQPSRGDAADQTR